MNIKQHINQVASKVIEDFSIKHNPDCEDSFSYEVYDKEVNEGCFTSHEAAEIYQQQLQVEKACNQLGFKTTEANIKQALQDNQGFIVKSVYSIYTWQSAS